MLSLVRTSTERKENDSMIEMESAFPRRRSLTEVTTVIEYSLIPEYFYYIIIFTGTLGTQTEKSTV